MTAPHRSAGALTLPELVAAVPVLLASDYGGVRSGRIRDLPDARTVRWYQTLGMVDRPVAFRGRTALYGGRHLLQLAAIKKLQSSGLSLSDIQRGLVGGKDAELARSAGVTMTDVERAMEGAVLARSKTVTDGMAAAVSVEPRSRRRRDSAFWKAAPVAAAASVLVPDTTRGMQSANLGGAGMLLWTGRPLTAAERSMLDRLSEPLIVFLQSVQTSAAGMAAENAPHAAVPPHRPEKGVRP